ncbi:Hypothetical protein PMT9312_1901 [Prochlorococcus marinus str. MIT 9312]|uniref:Uncharacterized protein n=1 Tax=Prochlorococcus marinus (strain MIT 9312) TaxID=74546 RepID=A7FAK1_PROM9|nr:Hypothetical protein PMT9312_1901 [Prochlorococcus marinus str. MIT 9312]KGG00014.1 hypothetical protein EU97_0944 [Prochlorococcus marinus str. MIT 9311]
MIIRNIAFKKIFSSNVYIRFLIKVFLVISAFLRVIFLKSLEKRKKLLFTPQ